MKLLQKYIYWGILSVALVLMAFAGLRTSRDFSPRFCIAGESAAEEIRMYDAGDGNSYVFLPSYADLKNVTVAMAPGKKIKLDGVLLENGMNCGCFSTQQPYRMEVNGRNKTTFWFLQSENVASMYVETATGTMEYIHRDKNYEETVSVTLYTQDGTLNYRSVTGKLKGRGNATWRAEKRPYILTLPPDADLLGMGAGAEWILLANAYDESNLRNKLVFDLAKQAGMEWTPDGMYTDVYINGEYRGLYLLTEKVEAGSSRLPLDTAAGDFLCKVDLASRRDELRNPFTTLQSRTVELRTPEIPSQEDYDRICSLVNQMEQIFLSGDDRALSENIDLDSWVRRYLIDEISGNIDSDLASSYFYCCDGVMFAGPVWDYDFSFGNSRRNQNPVAFIANVYEKAQNHYSPYYRALYENPSFHSRMAELYEKEFLPVLQRMIDRDIEQLSSEIEAASRMNSIRWREMFRTVYEQETAIPSGAASLTEYLNSRVQFLNSAWLEGREFCTVQFELVSRGANWNISVEKGTLLHTDYVDLRNTQWLRADTGEAFDFSRTVTEDVILHRGQSEQTNLSPEPSLTAEVIITVFSALTMGLILVVLLISDFRQRLKERRMLDAGTGTKISA